MSSPTSVDSIAMRSRVAFTLLLLGLEVVQGLAPDLGARALTVAALGCDGRGVARVAALALVDDEGVV
jgi:hypothetical protein